MIVEQLPSFLLGYLLGCVPFALLIGLARGIDIRTSGSKNIGATNLLRLAGKGPGFTALFLDIGKGTLAVLLARYFTPGLSALLPAPLVPDWLARAGGLGAEVAPVMAGVGAILGHSFNLFLRFKGGKAVAVSCGVFLALSPWQVAAALATFIIVVFATRYVSLGSISAATVFASGLLVFPAGVGRPVVVFGVVVAALIWLKHRSNIQRLWRGQENKVSLKK